MRLAIVVLACTAGTAHADKKIQDMIPGYEREHGGCTTQQSGMLKVSTSVALLAKSAAPDEKDELDKAAATLAKGTAVFVEYCTEVGGLVAYLKDHAGDPYKSVEREIDKRANKVFKIRRDAKRTLEELQPLTRKMIPRIMKAPPAEAPKPKATPVKFPSGRTIELPALGGAWTTAGTAQSDVAEYADKQVTATLTTRATAGACTTHRAIPKDATDPRDVEAPGVTWAVRYVRKESSGAHATTLACLARGERSVLATVDVVPVDAPIADKLLEVALKMAAELK